MNPLFSFIAYSLFNASNNNEVVVSSSHSEFVRSAFMNMDPLPRVFYSETLLPWVALITSSSYSTPIQLNIL